MIRPGVTLGGRYRLDERIAGGGMGDVWRGTDEVLGRTVAVKILLPALLDEPGFAERFRGEARTMATINHPGVVDVYDYGSDQQLAFLVMEYVEGDALSRTLSRVGRLTPARTMALVAQAADALQAAHANGIVHRDVKPGNLLVRPNGTLVLTDFGIARSALVGQLTVAGAVLGTASYISPEQAAGDVATPASDVYALGVVAYQCLSGHRPFDGATPIEIAMKHVRETPRPLPGDIPPAVRAIVDRAMDKDPSSRWPSAAAMASVARQAAASLTTGIVQPPISSPPHSAPPHSAPPHSAPHSGPPHSGQARPQSGAAARASVPRPVSGSGARGAASVPTSPPPQMQPPYRQPAPAPQPPPYRPQSGPPAYSPPVSPGAKPENTFGRQVLIVLAVVLALLVLLCAGVISFLLRDGNGSSAVGSTLGYQSSSAAILRSGVVADPVSVASYRLMKADAQLGRIRLNEGRQTL
ncbi:protein kinase [Actinoplanes sp. NPDC023714]|uniref:serine/threonine-protein kinase n=1 Tax=Actinoplanes sp. NPDC023714 TaxID=3154322 RepID=UPI0033D8BC3B